MTAAPVAPGPWDGLVAASGVPCGLFETDGVTALGMTRALISNAQLVRTVGARGDVIKMAMAGGIALQPGQLVNVPDLALSWYVVVKRLLLSRPFLVSPPSTYGTLGMPYTLTFLRRVLQSASIAPTTLDIYDEPLQATPTTLDVATTEVTTIAGLSASGDPLSDEPEGSTPMGTATAYVPLGVIVQLGDQVSVADLPMRVTRLGLLYADGQAYARQVLLEQTTGETLPEP